MSEGICLCPRHMTLIAFTSFQLKKKIQDSADRRRLCSVQFSMKTANYFAITRHCMHKTRKMWHTITVSYVYDWLNQWFMLFPGFCMALNMKSNRQNKSTGLIDREKVDSFRNCLFQQKTLTICGNASDPTLCSNEMLWTIQNTFKSDRNRLNWWSSQFSQWICSLRFRRLSKRLIHVGRTALTVDLLDWSLCQVKLKHLWVIYHFVFAHSCWKRLISLQIKWLWYWPLNEEDNESVARENRYCDVAKHWWRHQTTVQPQYDG